MKGREVRVEQGIWLTNAEDSAAAESLARGRVGG